MLHFPKKICNILVQPKQCSNIFKYGSINIVSVMLAVEVIEFAKTPVLVMLSNAYTMRYGESYPKFVQRANIWASSICLKSILIGLLGSQEVSMVLLILEIFVAVAQACVKQFIHNFTGCAVSKTKISNLLHLFESMWDGFFKCCIESTNNVDQGIMLIFYNFSRLKWCLNSATISIGFHMLGVLPQDLQGLAMGWVLRVHKFLVS